MRHMFKEAGSGLRRNLTMTLAVIMTMWVSLTLFGIGVLANQQVNLLKGKWYDKVQVTVYLCNEFQTEATCDPKVNVTDAQKRAIEEALRSNPDVAEIYHVSKEEAYKEFKDLYRNSPMQDTLTLDQMQESFRVKLKNAENYESVKNSVAGMRGVESVQDLHELLDPFFKWLNAAKWATIGASALLLIAAALQISNTIRMAAFARRRELGIMRLVGASNLYIMAPFLLESLVSALAGIALAAVTLLTLTYVVFIRNLQVSLNTFGWISWPEAGIAIAVLAFVGIVLSIVPTLFATRRYLRV